jgi:hypothetical protein
MKDKNEKNKHGLARYVEAHIERKIRQRCGFGCVICGSGIYDYEHVDPEFHDAHIHDPEKMALLCMQCHGKISRRFWSKSKVKEAMQNPKCKQQGFSNEFFDFGLNHPYLRIGGVTLENCKVLIQFFGRNLFEIKPPEAPKTPFLFSGVFTDSKGNQSLKIVDNKFEASASNWDVVFKGNTMTIREGVRNIHLVLQAAPPNGIVVKRLNMKCAPGFGFEGNDDFLIVHFPGNPQRISGLISGAPIAISIGSPKEGYACIELHP